ncbi:molybdenum cofactor sulfurase [Jannaschia pagri]|uniref:Molybdenum cofactor sulfurase n=1 Tax=Jannaschia pagri TaxID=2829797 RepID=A0ABQ4NIK1_9RHOB|nr:MULTISPECIES: MOSC domain-containing protein [unclassified Jannaschia]GIT89874.1 molybdenum cofactor sulfurase [Jannaschia sp. AI_61]GIT94019.1 molybdenum cofactor sulfurase [Jannaschia sp. AI_62]
MPALVPTEIYGQITWLGRVLDRDAALASQPVETLEVTFAGPVGEDHGGLTRPSCSRVTSQHPKGTEIRNTRQLCVMSAEEMSDIARTIGVETFDPAWAGASVVISGIPDFTHLPPSSRIQGEDGTTLVVDMENRPCHLPAPVIDTDAPGHGRAFKSAAKGKRGVTAWVERPGTLRVGMQVRLHVPDQRAWNGPTLI